MRVASVEYCSSAGFKDEGDLFIIRSGHQSEATELPRHVRMVVLRSQISTSKVLVDIGVFAATVH